MNQVRKIVYNNKEILVVDYSGSRGDELIDIFESAKKLAVAENKQIVVFNIVDRKTYLSSPFMNHIRKELVEVDRLIDKQAIVGLSAIQHWILKGMNLWYKKQVYSFATEEEALEYLVK